MSVSGDIYGVVLNDKAELRRLAPQFGEKPYAAPPDAPVVYMKARGAIARGPIAGSAGAEIRVAATLALLMRRDATRRSAADALDCVGATSLALDLSLPQANYFRPAIAEANRDGFLALGEWTGPAYPERIVTFIDGVAAHEWSLERLLRPAAQLVADLSSFMTLRAGDVLLIGLPGDAPTAGAGSIVRAEAAGLASVSLSLAEAGS